MINYGDEIAASMAQTLKDAKFQKIFNTATMVKKASEEVAPEFANIEVSEESELVPEIEVQAQVSDPRADCIMCGIVRKGYKQGDAVCSCNKTSGCSLLEGCKDNCNCGCKVKQASFDGLVKSAFNSLMQASEVLEEAGFEGLSATALSLVSNLMVEAKAKKDDKKDKAKAKEKEMADKAKEKAKEKAAKEKEMADKNKAKDKMMKEKAKEKEMAEKNKAKDKMMKEKMMKDKDKKSGK